MLEKGWGNEIKPWLSCSSVALASVQYPALNKHDAVVTAEFKRWGHDGKEFQANLGYGASCLKKTKQIKNSPQIKQKS